jgi:DNA repair protein RadC
MNVRLTEEQKIRILNSEDVYKVMQQILLRENKIRRNQEHFWVVGLDNKNKILFIELVSLGVVNRVQVNPPEVFRMAIYKLAVKMILVHNHPSGEASPPSDGDLDMTDHMIKSGLMLKIQVIDHLIISEKEFLSMADEGIIEKLEKSGRYELVDTEKAELKKFHDEMIRERALIDVARKMKDKGYDIDTIKELTGLTKWDIKKL